MELARRRLRTRGGSAPAPAQIALLTFDTVVDFDAAANIYRACRRVGVTREG